MTAKLSWPSGAAFPRVALLAGVAIAAAAVEHAVGLASGAWSWLEFVQAAVRNLFLSAAVIGTVFAMRHPGAGGARSDVLADALPRVGQPEVSTNTLVRELADIDDIADGLDLMQCPSLADSWLEAYQYLDELRWSLADYVLRSVRIRQMDALQTHVTGATEGTDGDLGRAARAARTRSGGLARHVLYTNSVVAKWLVAHRVAIADPCYLDFNALYGRVPVCAPDAAEIAGDPIYLLVCHLHEVLERADQRDELLLRHLPAQLTLPVRAIRQEMAANKSHLSAAIELNRTVERQRAR